MEAAAAAYAAGRPVPQPPASLRLWALSKSLGGPVVDVLGETPQLLSEWECYAEAEAEADERRAAAERRAARTHQ